MRLATKSLQTDRRTNEFRAFNRFTQDAKELVYAGMSMSDDKKIYIECIKIAKFTTSSLAYANIVLFWNKTDKFKDNSFYYHVFTNIIIKVKNLVFPAVIESL